MISFSEVDWYPDRSVCLLIELFYFSHNVNKSNFHPSSIEIIFVKTSTALAASCITHMDMNNLLQVQGDFDFVLQENAMVAFSVIPVAYTIYQIDSNDIYNPRIY